MRNQDVDRPLDGNTQQWELESWGKEGLGLEGYGDDQEVVLEIKRNEVKGSPQGAMA